MQASRLEQDSVTASERDGYFAPFYETHSARHMYRSFFIILGVTALVVVLRASGPLGAQQEQAGPAAVEPTPRLPEDLFDRLDRNRDGVIVAPEITDEVQSAYGASLEEADTNQDSRITRQEFEQALVLPWFRDPATYAIICLLLGYAGFCICLDELLEPDRREYWVYALVACVACLGIALLCAGEWFFQSPPYLAWVLLVAIALMFLALVTGATKPTVQEASAERQQVYVVGKKPGGSAAAQRRQAQRPRGSLAPGRTVRRPPVSRSPAPPPNQSRRRPPQPPRRGQKPSDPKPPGGDKK